MYVEQVCAKISSQHKGLEGTAAFYVGEQLKHICGTSEKIAEIVLADLNNPGMTIVEAEQKIKEYADKNHKSAKSFCVPPDVAEDILRKFYGISGIEATPTIPQPQNEGINLEDFI